MNRAFRGSRTAGICLLLFCFLGILALFALGLGSAWFAPARILTGLWEQDRTIQVVILNLRLPRILMAILDRKSVV